MTFNTKKLFTTLIVNVLFMSAASAHKYYFDASATGGDTNGNGTKAQPYQSMTKLNTMLADNTITGGDIVLLKRGETWNDGIVCGASGSQGNPITIKAYGNGNKYGKPIIDVQFNEDHVLTCSYDDITISDLVLKNSRNDTAVFFGSHDIILRNVDVLLDVNAANQYLANHSLPSYPPLGADPASYNIQNYVGLVGNNGIMFKYGGNNVKIYDSTVRDIPNNGIQFQGSNIADATTNDDPISNVTVTGSYVSGARFNDCYTIHEGATPDKQAGSNFSFTDNKAEGCGEQGYDLTTGTNITLSQNHSNGNGAGSITAAHSASNIVIDRQLSHDEPTFNTAAAATIYVANVSITNSIFYGQSYHFLVISGGASNCIIKNNTFIWDDRSSLIDIVDNPNVIFRNNIFATFSGGGTIGNPGVVRYLTAGVVPSAGTFDYNIYDGTAKFYITIDNGDGTISRISKSFSTFRSEYSEETHGANGAVYLQNITSFDYHLTSQSTLAIDKGDNQIPDPAYDFDGAPRQGTVDIGAYEYISQ